MSARRLKAAAKEQERTDRITVAGAKSQRRCQCNLGISCSGEGEFACGTGGGVAFETGFCDHCRRYCGAGR